MPIIASEDLKAHLRITDANDDETIGYAVLAANDAVKAYCGRDFAVATGTASARLFYPDNPQLLNVDDFADATGFALASDTGGLGTFDQAWAASNYQLEPLNGRDGGISVPYRRIRAVYGLAFPSCSGLRASVRVTANWGWATVPDAVFQAALIKAARIFKRKDSPEGVLGGFTDLGAVRVSLQDDPDVQLLLAPYRRAEVMVA